MRYDLQALNANRVDLHFIGDELVPVRSPEALREEATPLFGLPLIHESRKAMAAHLVAYAATGRRVVVNFINAHCINVGRGNAAYRRALADSDLLLPDGSGMRGAAKLAGVTLGDNLNGTDLFPEVCARAAEAGVSLYLLGGAPGVAEAAGAAMQARYPGLKVAGARDGYFKPEETKRVIGEINRSGAGMVFVGFGVPLQELWIERHRDRLMAPVLLGVGGLFDYYSGRIARAPMVFRKAGCEWVWRLAKEPRRLAARYLIGNATFLVHAALHALVARGIASRVDGWAKRALDVAGAFVGLAVLLPILLATMLAIKLESDGPVLFRQTRIGRNGKPFTMFKFRSMIVDAEHRRAALLQHTDRDSTCFKMVRDPRVTRVGAAIRRLSIDELPQLINVLRGEMSLVGPRPALPQEAATYRGAQWQRLAGAPGLTCTWQVSGRARVPFDQQVKMDLEYLKARTIFTDIALLLRTVPAVLHGRGAY